MRDQLLDCSKNCHKLARDECGSVTDTNYAASGCVWTFTRGLRPICRTNTPFGGLLTEGATGLAATRQVRVRDWFGRYRQYAGSHAAFAEAAVWAA